MSDLTLSKKFALITLNGVQTKRTSTIACLKERCLIVSQLLDYIMCKKMIEVKKRYCFVNDSSTMIKESEKIVFGILKENSDNGHSIMEWVDLIAAVPKKQCNQFVNTLINEMVADHLIDDISSLLECDFNYQTSGIKIREYRSSNMQYHNEIEYVKAELLDGGAVSDEVISLIWLIKQSGDLLNIFSSEEVGKIQEVITKLYVENSFVNSLFSTNIKGDISRGWKAFLFHKNGLAKTQLGNGFISKIPALEKSESIFIQTEKMFANSKERIADVKKILESNGHICQVRSTGEISLMEIDNILYELIPDAVRVRVMNVHGVRLRRYII